MAVMDQQQWAAQFAPTEDDEKKKQAQAALMLGLGLLGNPGMPLGQRLMQGGLLGVQAAQGADEQRLKRQQAQTQGYHSYLQGELYKAQAAKAEGDAGKQKALEATRAGVLTGLANPPGVNDFGGGFTPAPGTALPPGVARTQPDFLGGSLRLLGAGDDKGASSLLEQYKTRQDYNPDWLATKGGAEHGITPGPQGFSPMPGYQESIARGEGLKAGAQAAGQLPYQPQKTAPGETIQFPQAGPDGRPLPIVSPVSPTKLEFGKKTAELDAKTLDEYRTKADASREALANLGAMQDLVNQGVYSGPTATKRADVVSFLNALPGNIKVDPKVANSQNFNAYAGQLVLNSLGGKLGGQVSDSDRKFIMDLMPRLESDPRARQGLIDFFKSKHQSVITTYERADPYARQNGGLEGFQRPATVPPAAAAPAPQASAPQASAAAGAQYVRTGTINGRRVGQKRDGTIEYLR